MLLRTKLQEAQDEVKTCRRYIANAEVRFKKLYGIMEDLIVIDTLTLEKAHKVCEHPRVRQSFA